MCVVSLVLELYHLTDTDWLEISDLHFPQLHDPRNKVLSRNRKSTGFISTSTNFDLGLLSLGLISPKNIVAHFTQPHGTNKHTYIYIYIYIYIRFVSLDLLDPNIFWPGLTFPRPNFSKIYWGSFRSSLPHQHTYRIRFPWPSGPKHILTWVYFPSAWFIYDLLGLALLSFTEPNTYIYI